MRFVLRNGTRYRDDDLLGVIRPIIELVEFQKGGRFSDLPIVRNLSKPGAARYLRVRRSKVVTIEVAYQRSSAPTHRVDDAELGEVTSASYTGYAFLYGTATTLRVPPGGVDARCIAALWLHELWHLYGVEHRDMPASVNRCAIRSVSEVALPAATFAEPPPAPRPTKEQLADLRAKRRAETVERLEERRAEWARKHARAERAIAKIDRSLAGYRRRAATS